jgi:predicted pyridoxine 5'-phosphate oxidase superfamily flavin-nucleotide-binding protein
MSEGPDLEANARAIIDANLYMVLGTADEAGRPGCRTAADQYILDEHGERVPVSLT